jgi:hypothetical protein
MAYFLQPYLNQAYTYFRKVIEHLTELAKAGKAPAKQKHTNEPGSQEARKPGSQENIFFSRKAERLLQPTCAELASQGIPTFPFLLGGCPRIVIVARARPVERDFSIV